MDLLLAVEKHIIVKSTGKQFIDWDAVCEEMNRHTGANMTKEAYRSKYRRIKKGKIKQERTVIEAKSNIKSTPALLKKLLKDHQTLNQLVEKTGLNEIEVLGHIGKLKNDGEEILDFMADNGQIGYVLNKKVTTRYDEYKHYHEPNTVIRIGVVSDTHICSKFWQPTYLKMAYEHMKSMGVDTVYHAGDITDGFYKDRMEETYAFGADAQVDEVVRRYPRIDGIKTFFITGNHDYTHMRNGGSDIGRAIANQRNDMIYLGRDFAKIWLTPKVDMDIVHPGDGTSYALSYQLQKRINNMSGGRKPKIMISGHYHKNFHMFYRNIHAVTAASFQAQSDWMRGKAIESDIGFLVLDISINDNGDIIEFVHRYFPYYVPISQDYKNII